MEFLVLCYTATENLYNHQTVVTRLQASKPTQSCSLQLSCMSEEGQLHWFPKPCMLFVFCTDNEMGRHKLETIFFSYDYIDYLGQNFDFRNIDFR